MTAGRTAVAGSEPAILLVGAGPVSVSWLRRLARQRRLVALDGGADTCLAAGLMPDMVVGDLDSISNPAAWRRRCPLVHLPDQNHTDLEKGLAFLEAPAIIGLGCLGGRLDHGLAAIHALAACRKNRPVMLVDAPPDEPESRKRCKNGNGPESRNSPESGHGTGTPARAAPPPGHDRPDNNRPDHDQAADVLLRVRGDFRCAGLAAGGRFSVWPLGRQSFHASTGLRYPLDGLTLEPGQRIGTSNQVIAAPDGGKPAGAGCTVTIAAGSGPGYLVITGLDGLAPLLLSQAAFGQPPSGQPPSGQTASGPSGDGHP